MEQTFEEMMKIGDPIEVQIFNVVKQVYPLSERLKDDSGDIDTHSPAGIIEIKSETVSESSNRYMVEVNKVIGFNGLTPITKPSGLSSTKSKYWIQVDAGGKGEMYILLTTDLQKFIEDNRDNLIFNDRLKTNQGGFDTYNQVYFVTKKQIMTMPFKYAGYLRRFDVETCKSVIV